MIGPGVPEVFDIPIDQVIASLIRRGRSIESTASRFLFRRRVRVAACSRDLSRTAHPTSPREDRDASARRNPGVRPRFSQLTRFSSLSREDANASTRFEVARVVPLANAATSANFFRFCLFLYLPRYRGKESCH